MSSGVRFPGNLLQQVAAGISQLDDGIQHAAQSIGEVFRGPEQSRSRNNRQSSSASEASSKSTTPGEEPSRRRGSRRGRDLSNPFAFFMGNGTSSCGRSGDCKKKNDRRADSDFVFVDLPEAAGSGSSSGGAAEMFCDNCNSLFSRAFSRKKECSQCRLFFCDGCFGVSGGDRVCRRCKVLLRRPPVRADLLELRIKDLQRFLMSKRISMKNCVEKKDLVELVVRENGGAVASHSGAVGRQQGGGSSSSRPAAAGVIERQRVNFPKSYVTSTHRSEWFDRHQEGENNAVEMAEEAVEVVHTAASRTPEDAVAGEEVAEDPSLLSTSLPSCSLNPDDLSDRVKSSSMPSSPERQRRRFADQGLVYLSDITSVCEIKDLSAKQAKDILAMNRVNFKGVVDKADLLKIVERLWTQERQMQDGKEEMEDGELCKVCMDNPVDCVMLECGHMCTCTNCGKQMAECPICRQYVIRVVKTFRA